ncbi:MAG: TonB-linked SusC/RagA family outer membrane protein, partial [Saprospiraceae bacterium]
MKRNNLKWIKSLILIFFCGLISLTMQAQVSGIITDAGNGEALIGATVLVKGSTVGTISDIDGSYSIAAGPTDILVFSFTGYGDLEEAVGNRSSIDVAMSAGELLDEVVVTGYGTQSRRNVSGAVSTVEMDDLRSLPTGSVENALQGRVAGVQVSTSGAPGSATLVRVRGFGTINNNQPLYIIDGLPVQGGIIELNPNDIKSMTVLKDASAASIYGSRASNGVIIITTKNGSVTGKPTLTFDSYIGTQWAGNFPSFVSPQQFAELEAFEKPRNLGQPVGNSFYGTGASAVLPDYLWPIGGGSSVDESTYAYSNDLSIWNGITRANKEGTDWFDEMFNSALVKNYNISASGGTEKAQYTLGIGHLDQEGTRIHSGYQRSNVRANSLFRIKDKLRIGQNLAISFSRETGDRGIQGAGTIISNGYRQPSIVPVYDISGVNYSSNKGLGSASANAVQLAENARNNLNKKIRALGSVFLEVDILDNLTAKTSFSVDFANTDGRAISLYIPNDSEPLLGNSVSRTTNQVLNWTWYNTLTYKTTLAEDHDFSVIAGTEAIKNEFTGFGANRIQFLLEDLDFMVLDAGPADGQNAFGRRFESSLFSIFGKMDYAYKGKYLLSATLRRDGSSRFGANNRYAIFPAVSVGWRVSDEDFFNSSLINQLKIRGGWGKTGNQEIDNLAQYTLFSTAETNTATYAITGSNNSVRTGIQGTNIGNPDLKWEETTDINVGLDATLADNHVTFSFDVYKRNTKNLLLPVPPSTLIGAVGNQFRNVGEVQNTGFDLALGYNNRFTNGFSLDLSIVGSRYKNEVIALDESIGFIAGGSFRSSQYTRTLAGFPISSF